MKSPRSEAMYRKYYHGMIEAITGPMFSGKTEELIKRITILSYGGIKTLIIKPRFDNRFSEDELISRSGLKIETHSATSVDEIKSLFDKSYQAIVIDEVQFFNEDLLPFLDQLANDGIRVIVSGLDQNFLRKPFGIMPQLLAMAENVTKLKAVCLICKRAASTSYRKTSEQSEIQLGDADEYEARCRKCHVEASEKAKK